MEKIILNNILVLAYGRTGLTAVQKPRSGPWFLIINFILMDFQLMNFYLIIIKYIVLRGGDLSVLLQ